MKNTRGSALAIAVSMVFLFAVLGVGALNFGGAKRLYWTNQEANTQAFWLAEAGIQNAVSQLPATSPLPSGSLYTGTYSVLSITNPYNSNANQYSIIAKGINNGAINFNRIINAVYQIPPASSYTFVNRMITGDDVSGYGAVGNPYSSWSALFLAIFGIPMTGLNSFQSEATSLTSCSIGTLTAGLYYDTPPASCPTPNTLTAIGNIPASSVLVVNGNLSISGSDQFTGILWVTGNFTRTGNGSQIQGAVIVQGDSYGNGGGTNNNGHFGLNPSDTSTAITAAHKPYSVFWQECKNSTCT